MYKNATQGLHVQRGFEAHTNSIQFYQASIQKPIKKTTIKKQVWISSKARWKGLF